MDHCLYCFEDPDSEEHPLPAGLGEFVGGPILVGKLCKACNNERVGILDEQLLHAGPAAVLRRRFNVEGRKRGKKEKVNPFYRGSAGAPAVEVKSWDANFGSDVLVEPFEGRHAGHLIQMIVEEQTGIKHFIPLTIKTTVADIGKRIREIKGSINVRLIYDPDKEPWAADLVRKLWPDREIPEAQTGARLFPGMFATFQTTDRYYRAIAKIAFHYFLTQFPSYSGHEPLFDDVKTFIITDYPSGSDNKRINQFVGIYRSPLVPPLGDTVGHLLCAEIRRGVCFGHVELFASPDERIPAFRVRLGELDPSTPAARRATLFEYYSPRREGKYSGEAKAFSPDLLYLEKFSAWRLSSSPHGVRMPGGISPAGSKLKIVRKRFRQ